MIRICWFVVVLIFAGPCACRAALIAGWDFSNLGNPSSTVSATAGSGSLDISAFADTQQDPVAGTSVNAFPGSETAPGTALNLKNSSANGQVMIFSLNMSGYQDLVLTFATRGSATGFDTHTWSYSTDGSSYITLTGNNTAVHDGVTTFVTQTVDFSSISALEDNDGSIFIELKVSGATSSGGLNGFDNIQFNADPSPIPEPAVGGAIGGAGLLALCCWRIWRQRRSGEKLKS